MKVGLPSGLVLEDSATVRTAGTSETGPSTAGCGSASSTEPKTRHCTRSRTRYLKGLDGAGKSADPVLRDS